MTMRRPSNELFVDPVLGWAARFGAADTEKASGSVREGQNRPSRTQEQDKRATEGDKS
jgi:hypothetical protein